MTNGAGIRSNLFETVPGSPPKNKYLLENVFAEQTGPLILTINEPMPGITTFPELAWDGFGKFVRKLDKEFGVDALIHLGSVNHDYIDSHEHAPTKTKFKSLVTHDAYSIDDRFKLVRKMFGKRNFGTIPIHTVLGDCDEKLIEIDANTRLKEWNLEGGEKKYPILRLIPEDKKVELREESLKKYLEKINQAIPNLEKIGDVLPSDIDGTIDNGYLQGEIELEDNLIKFRHRWVGSTANPQKYTFAKWMHGEIGKLTDLTISDLIIQGHDGTHEHSALSHSLRGHKYLFQSGVFEDFRTVSKLIKEGYKFEPTRRAGNFPAYGVSGVKMDKAPLFFFASQALLEKIASDNKFDIVGQDYLVQHRQSDDHRGAAVSNPMIHQMSILNGMRTHVDQYVNTGDMLAGNGAVYPEFWVENVGDIPTHVIEKSESFLERIVSEKDPATVAALTLRFNDYLREEIFRRNHPKQDDQIIWTEEIFRPYWDKIRKESRLPENGIVIAPGNHPDHSAGRSSGMHPELLMLELYRKRVETMEELGALEPKPGFIIPYKDSEWGRLGYAEPRFGLPGGFPYLEMCAHKIFMKKGFEHDRGIGMAMWKSVRPNPRSVFQDETGQVYDRFTGINAGHYHYNWGMICTEEIDTQEGKMMLPVMFNDPGTFAESNEYSVMIGWKDANVGDQKKYLPMHGPNSGLLMTRMQLGDFYLDMWDQEREAYAQKVRMMASKDLKRLEAKKA